MCYIYAYLWTRALVHLRASTDALILVATVVLIAAPLPLPMNKSNLHNKEKQLEVHVVTKNFGSY